MKKPITKAILKKRIEFSQKIEGYDKPSARTL